MKLLKSIFVIVLAAAMMCGCWRPKVWENDFPSYKVNATVKYYFNLNRENSYSLDYHTLVVAVDDNGLKIDMFLWGTDIEASIVDFALGKGTANDMPNYAKRLVSLIRMHQIYMSQPTLPYLQMRFLKMFAKLPVRQDMVGLFAKRFVH